MLASTKVEVVIKDACILFDLFDLNLLANFYELKLTVVTREEVLAEVTDKNQLQQIQLFIEKGSLQIDNIDALDTYLSILETNPGLSLTDAAVLEAATRRGATILSSDKSLRNESTRRGITVRGLLWILEEMFRQEIISKDVLIEKLQLYTTVNLRAPRVEVENLIAKYKH
ncbi:hypothetical protein EXU57_24020 [Segetibacter sp. 3557_3]|uniref:hypothetical protein n=1 Tax=Segetibacter sp. 3557_3 TaxID=2547429 RepID=UPI001058CB76|nr:hypothetical protein [Segetibacter sp. 3557_3]TDH18248.1 hypothetical protein EXU57_24020 [Segetibacter sp. 3557_3]